MTVFRPDRASPPQLRRSILKPTPSAGNACDETTSSATSSALAGLTPEDVELIDTIIERAPSSATAFLTVFKAYNDVLKERGMNPADDIVYYKMLLKLGVVKGRDYGEKWRIVRSQHSYGSSSLRSSATTIQASSLYSAAGPSRLRIVPPSNSDSLTLRSQELATETMGMTISDSHSINESEPDVHDDNTLGLSFGPPCLSRHVLPSTVSKRQISSVASASEIDDSAEESEIIPALMPVYKMNIGSRMAAVSNVRDRNEPLPPRTSRLRVPVDQTHKESAINAEDAWKKVRMLQDERIADDYRREKLLERCMIVWLQGLQWIRDTCRHLDRATANLLLGRCLNKWRSRTNAKTAIFRRIAKLDDLRKLKAAMTIWKRKFKVKQHEKWRDNMRKRLNAFRHKRNGRVKEDAWAKWRQLVQSHLAGQRYELQLCLKIWRTWRTQLLKIDNLDTIADNFIEASNQCRRRQCYLYWRHRISLHANEVKVTTHIETKLTVKAYERWRARWHEARSKETKCDLFILKRHFRRWRSTLYAIRALDQKALRHQMRQNSVLVRAIVHVWAARAKGIILERANTIKLLQLAWKVWSVRMNAVQALEGKASKFQLRSSTRLLGNALRRWQEAHIIRQNAQLYAIKFHEAHTRYNYMIRWRRKLRFNLRMMKQAAMARRYLLEKQAWNSWKDKLIQKRRMKALQLYERNWLARYFQKWRSLSNHRRALQFASQIVQKSVSLRIMERFMNKWTKRVVDLKLRELEVKESYIHNNLTLYFAKWKKVYRQHAEDVSLMISYQDVKREETLRKMFFRWLTSARKQRHRRHTLDRCEEQLKRNHLIAVWERWRERLEDERLIPLEREIRIQFQNNLLFRAFALWHSRTKSGPAIRFDAMRVKSRTWKIWRAAMPHALQAKAARQRDKRVLLGRMLDKWVKIYRTKIALKAVARARYLRLPSGAPRSLLSAVPSRSTRSSTSGKVTTRMSSVSPGRASTNGSEREDGRAASPQSIISKPPLKERGRARLDLWTALQKERRRSVTSADGSRPKIL